MSSPCWIAFFDILNRSLELISVQEPVYVRASGYTLKRASDLDYIDDLISIARSQPSLQRKAALVSAFAITFGLHLAHQKLRLFGCVYGSEEFPIEPTATIVIYERGWIPVAVPIKTVGSLKFLGIYHDFDTETNTTMSLASNQLRATLRTIDSKSASGATKLAVARSSTVMSILFRAKHAGETLAAQEEITKTVSSYFRRWTHNLHGFPSRLLYAPTSLLGLGLPHYPTLVNCAKLNLLHRALYSSPTVRATAQSLLERVMRESVQVPASRDFPIPRPLNTAKSARVNFSQSLVEYLYSHGLQLRRGIRCPTPWQ